MPSALKGISPGSRCRNSVSLAGFLGHGPHQVHLSDHADDFARLHPGGTLGKRLYLRVDDLYPHNACPAVPPHADLPPVILEMTTGRLACTAVASGDRRLLGVITDGDLRRMLTTRTPGQLLRLRAADLMNPTPRTVAPHAYATEALRLLQHHKITQLVVTGEADRLLGFLHLHDLLREGIV